MSQIECQVAQISPLTQAVYKVELVPQKPVTFQAGQYVLVHMAPDDKRPFSIANGAFDNSRIELHIGADEANAYATEVLDRMKRDQKIILSGGHGDAYLQPSKMPIILIAGGTGFSYTYSILQECLENHTTSAITLYWGGRTPADLYLSEKLEKLAEQHPQFTFIPVVEQAPDGWQGRAGWVHHAVLEDHSDLSNFQVYIAGRFEMAKAAREDFAERKLPAQQLFGDAYAFI